LAATLPCRDLPRIFGQIAAPSPVTLQHQFNDLAANF
jgi:hypothetical protein